MRGAGRRLLSGLGLIAALVVAGVGFLLWRSPEVSAFDRAYALVFGPPDLGPVDFATLTRRSSPNDALACPADLCPNAKSDLVPPVFAVPAERLRAIVAEVALAEADAEIVSSGEGDEQDRYVVRTRLMRFPDTVDVRIIRQGEARATLALYSRSQIGYSDLGTNRARIERWLAAIAGRVAETPETTVG
jgi:uncharacterized protein (DUF1499 family)